MIYRRFLSAIAGTVNVFCTIMSLISFNACFAQTLSPEVVSPAGDYFSNGNNFISWTIGEPVVETFSGSANILTQGFQQPYFAITDISEKATGQMRVDVSPNPAADFLSVSVENNLPCLMLLQLYDITGKKLIDREIPEGETAISLREYPDSPYLLKITCEEESRVFKIIKSE